MCACVNACVSVCLCVCVFLCARVCVSKTMEVREHRKLSDEAINSFLHASPPPPPRPLFTTGNLRAENLIIAYQ